MNFLQKSYERQMVKLTFSTANVSFSKSGFPRTRNFYVLTRLKFTHANKIKVMHGSTFTFTRDTSYIASFICAHKFQACTYAKITRQWKSTISLVFMNECKELSPPSIHKCGKWRENVHLFMFLNIMFDKICFTTLKELAGL